jgi:hypothetical protein
MVLDEIVNIQKIGIRKTRDITVDGDHLFFTNDILTHNSASGDTNDISEENIQGGIAKIQSADNVLAFIPNSASRDSGIIRAKLLKTRDSSGVGSYVFFKTDWGTLSFIPTTNENGEETVSHDKNAYTDVRANSKQKEYTKLTKNKENNDSQYNDSTTDNDDNSEKPQKSPKTIINNLKGKNSFNKGLRLM